MRYKLNCGQLRSADRQTLNAILRESPYRTSQLIRLRLTQRLLQIAEMKCGHIWPVSGVMG